MARKIADSRPARLMVTVLALVLIPSAAFAWGPLTHAFLASELMTITPAMLPPAIYMMLRRHRQEFLYGTIMPDVVLAKTYLPDEHHNHSWDVAFRLLDEARNDHERAFCMGYLAHLAADTVAHGDFTTGKGSLHHTLLELRAERRIHHSHWIDTISISPSVQRRLDHFMQSHLRTVMFSFKLNRRVFKGAVMLSGLSCLSPRKLLLERMNPWDRELAGMHEEALRRMACVLESGKASPFIEHTAISDAKPRKLISRLLAIV